METPIMPGANNQSARTRNIIIACVIFDIFLLAGLAYYFLVIAPAADNVIPPPTLEQEEPVVTEPLTDNIFDATTVKYGDEIAGMTIAQVGPFNPEQAEQSADNIIVIFKGEVTVSGTWVHEADGMIGPITCMKPDTENAVKLPKAKGDQRSGEFCFSDEDGEKLGPAGTNGTATLVIDEYTYVYYPSEVVNSAKLVKIISKN